MGKNSDLFLERQEQYAFDKSNGLLYEPEYQVEPTLNELIEFDGLTLMNTVNITPEMSAMERHAHLLDERNKYMDLMQYSNKLIAASLNHKEFWRDNLERQYNMLYFIEGLLLDIESAAS